MALFFRFLYIRRNNDHFIKNVNYHCTYLLKSSYSFVLMTSVPLPGVYFESSVVYVDLPG